MNMMTYIRECIRAISVVQFHKSMISLSVILCMTSFSTFATHYVNKTNRAIIVTNVSEQKRQENPETKKKKRTWWNWNNRKYKKPSYKNNSRELQVQYQHLQSDEQLIADVAVLQAAEKTVIVDQEIKDIVHEQKPYVLNLEDDQEGDLDNAQGDEITITSPGMSDKRKLFPTNNSFNYVVTLNNYNKKFEQFDINRAE